MLVSLKLNMDIHLNIIWMSIFKYDSNDVYNECLKLNQFEGWTSLWGLKYNQNTKDKDFQKELWSIAFGPP
jgi:hypothetical protein